MSTQTRPGDRDLLDTLTARDLEQLLQALWDAAPEWVGGLEYCTEHGRTGPLCLAVWIWGREDAALITVEDLAEVWWMSEDAASFTATVFGTLQGGLT